MRFTGPSAEFLASLSIHPSLVCNSALGAWHFQEELENRGLAKVNWEWSRVEQLALPLQLWRSLPGWGDFAVVRLLWGSPMPLLVTPYPRFGKLLH